MIIKSGSIKEMFTGSAGFALLSSNDFTSEGKINEDEDKWNEELTWDEWYKEEHKND